MLSPRSGFIPSAGVRFTPGQSAAMRSAREARLQELYKKFQPSSSPAKDVAREIGQLSPGAQPAALPYGGDRAYQQLKEVGQSKYTGYQTPAGKPLRISENEALMTPGPTGELPRGVRLSRVNAEKAGADILVSPRQTPFEKLDTLAHELGHELLSHSEKGDRSTLPLGAKEAEAQAASYAYTNKLYPWQKSTLRNAAIFAQESQRKAAFIEDLVPGVKKGSQQVDPVEYLSRPDVAARIRDTAESLAPEDYQPFRRMVGDLSGYAPKHEITIGPSMSPPGVASETVGLSLRRQKLTPREIATGQPQSSAVMREGLFQDSFRINQPGRGGSSFTLSSDRALNEKLRSTGTTGDSKGIGLRGKLQPAPVDPLPAAPQPELPQTKPTKLTLQAGDRLLAPSETRRLAMRGQHLGLGFNSERVPPANPRQAKLGYLIDLKRKSILDGPAFQAEVERAGLQQPLQSARNLGQTLRNNRGGGEIFSGSQQKSAFLKGSPKAPANLPQATEVLGEQGFSRDSFSVNQPGRPSGQPVSAPTRDLQLNMGLKQGRGFAGDSTSMLATKALGYKPTQFAGVDIAIDRATGEMVTRTGKPLPPMVGPHIFSGEGGSGSGGSARPPAGGSPGGSGGGAAGGRSVQFAPPKVESPFRQGFDVSLTGKSVLQRTPDLTEGMNFIDRAKFAGGRLAGDVAADATRSQWWRYNHPLAIASQAGQIPAKLAGAGKGGQILAGFATAQALSLAGGNVDLRNLKEAGRPQGYQAVFPDAKDPTKTTSPIAEFGSRYILGRTGQLLPYEKFKKERPEVSKEQYDYYSKYLKGGKAAENLPDSFDVARLGVLKGTSRGIDGPEVRFMGYRVTPGSAGAAALTSVGAAAVLSPKVRARLASPAVSKALGVAGAGLDFASRIKEGQSIPTAARGTAATTAIAAQGATYGASLGARFGPVGAVVGGLGGAVVAGATGGAAVEAVDKKADEIRQKAETKAGDPISNFLAQTPLGKLAINLLPGGKKEESPQPQQQSAKSEIDPEKLKQSLARPADQPDPFAGLKVERDEKGDVLSATNERGEDVTDDFVDGTHNRKSKKSTAGKKGGSGGGMSGADRIKVAELQHGKGGSVDRQVQGRLDQETIKGEYGNQRESIKGEYGIQRETVKGEYGLKNTDLKGQYQLKNTALQNVGKVDVAKINVGGKIKVAEIGYAGKQLQYGKGGSVDRTNQSKEKIADVTSGRKLEGQRYTADQRLAGVQDTNRAKLQVADVTSGRKLEGQVYTADRRLEGQAYTADQRLVGQRYTADQRLRGETYKADASVDRESVKSQGAVRVAAVRAAGQMGAASTAAGARVAAATIVADGGVRKADVEGRYKLQVADLASQRKSEDAGSNAAAKYLAELNKAQSKDKYDYYGRMRALGVV